MKKVIAIVLAVAMLATLSGVALAENYQEVGHGALSGPHYNLNIIGVENTKNPEMKNTSGHTIFVPLKGNAKIWLCESGTETGCLPEGGFQVLDRNGMDSDGALFALPNPDPENDGVTEYTVYARAVGTPGGKSFTTTCEYDPSAGETVCSSITMKLERRNGKPCFQNVSKYLLYIYTDEGRIPLFADELKDYFWYYDNHGLKVAQLRFYETPTTVPDEQPYVDSITPDCGTPGTSNLDVVITVDFPAGYTVDILDGVAQVTFENRKIDVNSYTEDSATQLIVNIDIRSNALTGDGFVYITLADGTTINTTFTVATTCP